MERYNIVLNDFRYKNVEYLIHNNIKYRRYLTKSEIEWYYKEFRFKIENYKKLEYLYQNMIRVEKLERVLKK